jgi:hypothetical protein
MVLEAARLSSLRVTALLEACVHTSAAPASAWRMHLSWGSCPLQRSTILGARMSRKHPTSGTVRPQGFSPPRRLASPKTLRGLFHPRCAPGVPADLPRSLATFRSKQGESAHVSSPRRSPLP